VAVSNILARAKILKQGIQITDEMIKHDETGELNHMRLLYIEELDKLGLYRPPTLGELKEDG
jgi:hypothetical protein